jgi:ADP-ribose pyrophosphatase
LEYLVASKKVQCVMPDLIRHPDHIKITGFRLPDQVRHKPRRNDALKKFPTFCGIVKFGGAKNLKSNNALAKKGYPAQPVVAVGAIVFKNNRVLLVRRGQPPSQDLWAIPGGRVKLGETLQKAAEREILEETGITIQAGEPVYTFDYIERDGSTHPRFHYVIIDLVADYVRGKTRAGDDAAEVRWVAAEELASLNVSSKTLRLLKKRYKFGI